MALEFSIKLQLIGMGREIFILFLACAIKLIYSQSIDCVYSGTTTYGCDLVLNNPQGFDNFTTIGGTHLPGKNDSDVVEIYSYNGTTRNFPSIICEKFPNLVQISVTGVGIRNVSERSFAGCTKATYIGLDSNSLTSVPVNLLVCKIKFELNSEQNHKTKNFVINIFLWFQTFGRYCSFKIL